jgi:uncharacterized protein (DUF362 family)
MSGQVQPMSGAVSRRRFLESSLLGVVGAAWGADALGAPRDSRQHALPDEPRPPPESTIAVVRADGFPSLAAAVEEAIRLAGGLSFIGAGDTVLLKPAVNSGRPYPATTDPEVVLAVARLVQGAGGRPFVADRTMFLRSTQAAFEQTGILDAARAAGIPCLALDDEEVVTRRHPLALHWPQRAVEIYRPVAEADHVINLCTPRTHRLGGFTMAMKNCVGAVSGAARPRMHLGPGLRERLAEISLVVKPALVLLDGRLGFSDGGPDQGELCRPGFIAAGSDPLAMDAVGIAHLRLAGTNAALGTGSIWRIPQLRRAAEIGIGASSADRIHVVGLAPDATSRIRRELA